MSKSFVWPLIRTLLEATTPGHSRPGSNRIEVIFHMLHSHILFMQDTYCRNDNRRAQEDFFNNILPLTLLQGFEKGYSKFACERELETEQKLQYFDLKLMAGNVVSFSFSSGPQFNQGSREPLRLGVAFPTTSCLQLSATQLASFCSIRRPYITFKLSRGDMDTPPRLRNFIRYLTIGMCHFHYLWNGLCFRHRAEITVMQFTLFRFISLWVYHGNFF